MARKTISDFEFPEYLGLGTLDRSSIERKGKSIQACYLCGDDLIFRVLCSPGYARIEEYFTGQKPVVTQAKDLKNAFLRHNLSFTPYENRRFERLYHEICDGRNITIRFPQQPVTVYYPAGYIFALRLPVTGFNRHAWDVFAQGLEKQGDQTPLRVEANHPAVLFRLLKSGEVREEEISVVDCSAMLIHLSEAARMLWENGVIPPGKEYRLSISEASEIAPGSLSIFPGEPERGILTYSIVTTDKDDPPKEEMASHFLEMSKQFLNRAGR